MYDCGEASVRNILHEMFLYRNAKQNDIWRVWPWPAAHNTFPSDTLIMVVLT